MNKKRLKQIEELANEILLETGCYSIPVRVREVVGKKYIDIDERDLGNDVSGVLLSDGRSAIIGVNNKNKEPRKRFTLAHELGHYVLGHQREGVFVDTPHKYLTILFRDENSSTGEYLQEREANAFAASLLMPRELVIEKAKEIAKKFVLQPDSDIVEILASEFEVSNQAMGLRLSNLGLLW